MENQTIPDKPAKIIKEYLEKAGEVPYDPSNFELSYGKLLTCYSDLCRDIVLFLPPDQMPYFESETWKAQGSKRYILSVNIASAVTTNDLIKHIRNSHRGINI